MAGAAAARSATPEEMRAIRERFAQAMAEKRRRLAKIEQSQRCYYDDRGRLQGGLIAFIRHFWRVLEPSTPFVDGWPLEAICLHLEAVTFGEIQNLLMNVPPGFMKSLVTDVFWPAWEWGPMKLAHLRYVAFSYSASLTERDNAKFRDLMQSSDYQAMYGDQVKLRKTGETKVTNHRHGWKLATSVSGVGTGERGDRVIFDDPHNVKESESKTVRDETVRFFREALSSRLNNVQTGSKIVIMQRVHEDDVSGSILSDELDYVHLMIPMEYEWSADDDGRPFETSIGWSDPRWSEEPDECNGLLAWPERFPPTAVRRLKKELGPYAYAGQYQQTPEARGGGIFKRSYWQPWEPADGRFPPFSYVVASLDTAYTEDKANDPSGFTIWGVFDQGGFNRAMLVYGAEWWKEIQGEMLEQEPGESRMAFVRRAMPQWGLVEVVHHYCNHYKVDRLLIEAKASGLSVAQTLRRKFRRQSWGIQLIPVKGDKVSRAHAVQPTFSQGMVYYPTNPVRPWGQLVVDAMAVFPKGKHDDITDSATQAIRHLRDLNLLTDDDEIRAETEDAVRHQARADGRPKLPHMR